MRDRPYERRRVAVFLGPSLPRAQARSHVQSIPAGVTLYPPVRQGDIIRLYSDLPDVIAIADGFFFQQPAVYHKEILRAIELGARVAGAASLGALRAAELDRYGMLGIGRIYRLYRDGIIDGDDEVAVAHAGADENYRALSTPLAEIRENLSRAVDQGAVSRHTATRVLGCAKRLYFPDRTVKATMLAAREMNIPPRELDDLMSYLESSWIDVKAADAQQLLAWVSRVIAADSDGHAPGNRVNQTTYFAKLQRDHLAYLVRGRWVTVRFTLNTWRLLSGNAPATLASIARVYSAVDQTDTLQLRHADSPSLLQQFKPWQQLSSDKARSEWLRRHYLTLDELVVALRERDLANQYAGIIGVAENQLPGDTSMTHPMRHPGAPWEEPLIRELKLRGDFTRSVDLAWHLLDANQRFDELHPHVLSRLDAVAVTSWFARRWGVSEQSMADAVRQRGFSEGEFIETAKAAYVYDWARRRRIQTRADGLPATSDPATAPTDC